MLDWRYEIKYIISKEQLYQLNQLLIEHPASFRTAFPDRLVNNIYYDTPDFQMCRDNLAGIAQRRKVRLRWYGDASKIVKPVVEEKIKNNSLGRKENHRLSDDFSEYDIMRFVQDDLLYEGKLIPVLQNQYRRAYFINLAGNFRLTVDSNIHYQKAWDRKFTNRSHAFTDERLIVELKFKQADLPLEKEISRFIPFRPTKHSKYVTGVLSVMD